MNAARVLVVADEYYASLAAVRALRRGGYAAWVATTTDDCLAAHSGAAIGSTRIRHPSDGADAFADDVGELARSVGAVVVLPGTEPALAALAGRDLGGIAVGAPGADVVARVTDKEELAAAAERAGLSAPGGVRVAAPTGEVPDVRTPAIVKPARSTVAADGRTVDLPAAIRVEDAAELARVLLGLPRGDYLVQPFVEGALGAIAGVAWDGGVVCLSQQVARRIHPPGAGASAFAETVAVDDDLARRAGVLLADLDWSGLWELQFIAGRDGPVLIDFNPRFYGSLALAVAAGLNLPAIWVDLLLGRPPRVGRYRPGTRYRAEARDAKLLLEALRGGRLGDVARIAAPQRRTTHAVFSWRDPAPASVLVRRAFGR